MPSTVQGDAGGYHPVGDPSTPVAGSGMNTLISNAPLNQSMMQPVMFSTPSQPGENVTSYKDIYKETLHMIFTFSFMSYLLFFTFENIQMTIFLI